MIFSPTMDLSVVLAQLRSDRVQIEVPSLERWRPSTQQVPPARPGARLSSRFRVESTGNLRLYRKMGEIGDTMSADPAVYFSATRASATSI